MIKIYRKEGWELNPNDKTVNSILRRVEVNDGECPCSNDSVDTKCPCSNYREKDRCCCGLYVKKKKPYIAPEVNIINVSSESMIKGSYSYAELTIGE